MQNLLILVADENRPNPDALLSSIQREGAAKQRGRLKVFLGMSPGVGKTYAMLMGARGELIARQSLTCSSSGVTGSMNSQQSAPRK